MGKVYMFNVNAEEMNRIQIRNFSTTSTIKGWSNSESSLYQPNAMAIDRFKNDDPNFGFMQGDNLVTFSRPTYNGLFTLPIDREIPLSDNLILYVFRARAILFRTNGEIIKEVPFAPTLAQA